MALHHRNHGRSRSRHGSVAANADPSTLGSLDISQLAVDTSSSDSDFTSSRPSQKPSHGRSMSNPFPSLFSTMKKKKTQGQGKGGSGGSDSSGGEEQHEPGRHKQKTLADSLPVHTRPDNSGFSTGPCITCGSLVRWARGVEVFRCSICMTINDLPHEGMASSRRTVTRTKTAFPGSETPPALTGHISIERSRSMIKRCLRKYLEAVLTDVGSQQHTTGPSRAEQDMSSRQSLQKEPISSGQRSYPGGDEPGRPNQQHHDLFAEPSVPAKQATEQSTEGGGIEAKKIFKDLEDYVVAHFLASNCLDHSFLPPSSEHPSRYDPGALRPQPPAVAVSPTRPEVHKHEHPLLSSSTSQNGPWRLGSTSRRPALSSVKHSRHASETGRHVNEADVTCDWSRPIYADWSAVDDWYNVVINAGAMWKDVYDGLVSAGTILAQPDVMLEQVEAEILKAQKHAQRVVLKAIETVLKRPGRRIRELGDYRFLVIALANPLLHASFHPFTGFYQAADAGPSSSAVKPDIGRGTGPASGQHSVIIKRILGLMSNSSDAWHNELIACFSRFSNIRFMRMKDLVTGFFAYRLVRQNKKLDEAGSEYHDSLVPKIPTEGSVTSLHAALNHGPGTGKKEGHKELPHGSDWQIKASVRVLRLLFMANDTRCKRQRAAESMALAGEGWAASGPSLSKELALPTSDFYIALLDNLDLIRDYEAWGKKRTKFSFCQYPFLLSIWAKIQILEYEARQQMKNKARDAFFDSIMTHRTYDQHFVLSVRRECLVEDSLKGVSEAVGSGSDDIKKGLRIVFNGEEGVDAGGLRKEWFLLLVREVFNPDHGMFTYDDESHYCYFNPNSFETSDQFFLVGVVLGLAIYNSTILDIALPPFAFRKLLQAAPIPTGGTLTGHSKLPMSYTLVDLAEYRPRLAKGLQQLLEFDGDVESVFGLDFTIAVERFGAVDNVPLCPGGEKRAVTSSNRREYVDLYIRYLLDTSVSRQFDPFKRGFFTVCGCNALELFQPEEIELLVRGSDEPLNIESLKLAATYDNWGDRYTPEKEPSVQWFWQTFAEAGPKDQRKLLIFITGSDRIPATGPASLSIRILCLGEDTGRYPTARTCFNTLTLYRYRSKESLQQRLWGAVHESEGFGLK